MLVATYPDDGGGGGVGAGTGDPGYLPHIAENFLDQGFSAVTIYRWGSNGATSAVTRDTHWNAAWQWAKANGVTFDVALTVAGTNNATSPANAALFLTDMRELSDAIEGTYRSCRLGYIHPVGDNTPGVREHMDDVRDHLVTLESEKSTRFGVTRTGLDISVGGSGDMADTHHPALTGYRDQMDLNLISAWEGAS